MTPTSNTLINPINDLEGESHGIPYGTISPTVKDNSQKIIYIISYSIVFVLWFPTLFCDYYYAVNNIECLKQPLHISLTMYDYLLTNAILGSILLSIILMTIITTNVQDYENPHSFTRFACHFMKMICSYFTIAWTIVGSIMFWGQMNQSLCSSAVNNYLTASLIIKFISILIDLSSGPIKNL